MQVVKESAVDFCVFIQDDLIVLVYVIDCILLSQKSDVMETFIKTVEHGLENFIFADKENVQSYLLVEMEQISDGKGFLLTLQFLIQCIVKNSQH